MLRISLKKSKKQTKTSGTRIFNFTQGIVGQNRRVNWTVGMLSLLLLLRRRNHTKLIRNHVKINRKSHENGTKIMRKTIRNRCSYENQNENHPDSRTETQNKKIRTVYSYEYEVRANGPRLLCLLYTSPSPRDS